MTSHPSANLDELLANLAWMRGLATRVAAAGVDADDLSQEAALRVLSAPQARGLTGPRLRAWLARAVEGLARDTSRAAGRRRHREQAAARPEGFGERSDGGHGDLQSLRLQALASGLLELSEPYRTTVLLHYGEGLDTAAVALRMNASPAAIRQRLSRGRTRLRAHIEAQLDRGESGSTAIACLPLLFPVRPLAKAQGALCMLKTWMWVGGAGALLVGGLAWDSAERPRAAQLVAPDSAGSEGHELAETELAEPLWGGELRDPVQSAPAPRRDEPTPAPLASAASIAAQLGAAVPDAGDFADIHDPNAPQESCVQCHQGEGLLQLPSNLPDGWTKEFDDEGGILAEGVLELGRREGTWREYFPGGALRRSLGYLGGVEHGPFEEFDVEGRRRVAGDFAHGQRSGAWREWHGDGAQKRSSVYVGGRLDGVEVSWWPNGQRAQETPWDLGLRQGLERSWHDNGQLAKEARYVRGQVQGAVLRWTASGDPEAP